MPLDVATATRHLQRVDPVMRKIVKAIGPCELRPGARGDHFTTLARAIVGQQLSARAAETIWQRFVALHPNARRIGPEEVLTLSDAQMRSVGLSNAKVAYLKDLAARVASKDVRLDRFSRRDDDAIVADLIRVKGIGRWTVEMFLIFRLGRPDVWPVDDLGIRNAVRNAYGVDPTKANLVRVADAWRPWRTVASWYLWRSLALPGADASTKPPSMGRSTKVPV